MGGLAMLVLVPLGMGALALVVLVPLRMVPVAVSTGSWAELEDLVQLEGLVLPAGAWELKPRGSCSGKASRVEAPLLGSAWGRG